MAFTQGSTGGLPVGASQLTTPSATNSIAQAVMPAFFARPLQLAARLIGSCDTKVSPAEELPGHSFMR